MNQISVILNKDTREFFLFGLRLSFGFWILYVGLGKWLAGPAGFIGYIVNQFNETWVPELLSSGLGWIIIIAEPLVGLWLLAGVKQRLAWVAASKLMFLLMFGKTILGDYATVANNWQYLVIAIAAAAWTKPEE